MSNKTKINALSFTKAKNTNNKDYVYFYIYQSNKDSFKLSILHSQKHICIIKLLLLYNNCT